MCGGVHYGEVCLQSLPHRVVYKSTSDLGTPLYRTANWVSVVSFIERFHCTQTDYPLPLPIVLKAAIVISGKHTDGCSLYTCKRHNPIHGHTYLLHLFVYYWFPTVAARHALRWHLIWCSCNRRSECGKKLLYSEMWNYFFGTDGYRFVAERGSVPCQPSFKRKISPVV